jgi:hypothetical protein
MDDKPSMDKRIINTTQAMQAMLEGKRCRIIGQPLVYFIQHDELWYVYDNHTRPILTSWKFESNWEWKIEE